MPKKGIVKCQSCDAEFEGKLPDNEFIGYHYFSVAEEIDLDLVEKLQDHHSSTHGLDGVNGHKYFDVFLEDGNLGELEADSYSVIFTEKGKER